MEFIRMDMKGNWKDTEHCSSIANTENGDNGEADRVFEKGISCYRLDDKVEAIENLYKYWTEIASCTNIDDYTDKQVTVFEGYKLDKWGSDGEDLAICTKTLKVINAVDFMAKLFKAKDKLEAYQEEWEDEEQINEEEYKTILESLI